jgi:hypothetical protein
MGNFIEKKEKEISGHLQIEKIYRDPDTSAITHSEVILDDHNVITSGMAFSLAALFSTQGSPHLEDYRIGYFQVGDSVRYAAASSTYALNSELSSTALWGSNTSLVIKRVNAYDPATIESTGSNLQYFAEIPTTNLTMIADHSARATIVLDEETGNVDNALCEIGLFTKNPIGGSDDRAVMVAYRQFDAVKKTNNFSLVFRWTLNF